MRRTWCRANLRASTRTRFSVSTARLQQIRSSQPTGKRHLSTIPVCLHLPFLCLRLPNDCIDKVSHDQKDEAHEKFQAIAFAYTILSDPARRKRYDTTGSTSDAVFDADGFNWSDYYRDLFHEAVSADAIEKFAKKYKGSDEEKDDILVAYEKNQGDMDKIYETVMLSNVLEDDERYREIINQAIEAEDVPAYRAYTKESKRKREARLKAARGEADEAEEYAKELGVHDKLFGDKKASKSKKGKAASGEDDLAALIAKNQQSRSGFLDNLAEKYGATSKPKKSKRAAEDEPSEEAFQAAAARLKKPKRKVK